MVGPGEIARRARSRVSGRLESLPILALSVHSACNCRCVMCDIWKANGEKRNSASNPRWPSTLISLNPKNSSASAPNCTVLLVTAK